MKNKRCRASNSPNNDEIVVNPSKRHVQWSVLQCDDKEESPPTAVAELYEILKAQAEEIKKDKSVVQQLKEENKFLLKQKCRWLDTEARKCNVVVHGVQEGADVQFRDWFKESGIHPVEMRRIGSEKAQPVKSPRPILMKLRNTEERKKAIDYAKRQEQPKQVFINYDMIAEERKARAKARQHARDKFGDQRFQVRVNTWNGWGSIIADGKVVEKFFFDDDWEIVEKKGTPYTRSRKLPMIGASGVPHRRETHNLQRNGTNTNTQAPI